MRTMASQITSLTIVYSTFYSGTEQRKHQSPASLAFVMGIRRSHIQSMLDLRSISDANPRLVLRTGLLWKLHAKIQVL